MLTISIGQKRRQSFEACFRSPVVFVDRSDRTPRERDAIDAADVQRRHLDFIRAAAEPRTFHAAVEAVLVADRGLVQKLFPRRSPRRRGRLFRWRGLAFRWRGGFFRWRGGFFRWRGLAFRSLLAAMAAAADDQGSEPLSRDFMALLFPTRLHGNVFSFPPSGRSMIFHTCFMCAAGGAR
jgi:hypothetical protein